MHFLMVQNLHITIADLVLMDMIVEGKLRAFALNKPIFHQSSDLASSIGIRGSWV